MKIAGVLQVQIQRVRESFFYFISLCTAHQFYLVVEHPGNPGLKKRLFPRFYYTDLHWETRHAYTLRTTVEKLLIAQPAMALLLTEDNKDAEK